MDDSEELRRCGGCKDLKPVEQFAWRRKARGQRDNLCRRCRSAYGREHYLANRERYVRNAAVLRRKVRLERTRWLIEFFRGNPCVDCGESDPVVLEFDHLGEKSFDVGQGLADRNWQSVLDEIAKCQVVCANCHRRRTAKRRGAMRITLTEA
jgi:hypothetical protein